MKRYLYVLIISLAALMTGCKQPDPVTPDPEVNITEGTAAPEQLAFYVSATQADEIAFICVETTEEVKVYKAEALFEEGEVFAATEEPVAHTVAGLKPETEYTVYAAAMKEEGAAKYYSAVKELSMTTGENPVMLQFVSASKTGFSYKVTVGEGETYFHTYVEGWSFEYQYEMAKLVDGPEFNHDVFLWNMLATSGIYAEESQTVNWFAGKEDETTGRVAYLVPGIKYYAVAAKWDSVNETWNMEAKPEVISFSMQDPGESPESVTCTLQEVTPKSATIRMECDETKVNFYIYDIYSLDQYEAFVAKNGIEGMMSYVSEYGYRVGNTYTDTWTLDPGKSYMLCLYGVDYNGDEFYNELQVDIPLPEPSVSLSMETYEREMQGFAAHNTLRVSSYFADFIGLDYASSVMFLPSGPVTREKFDAYVATMGLSGTLEEIQEYGEQLYYVGTQFMQLSPISADEEALVQLVERGTFEKIYTDLEPDTEYVYMVLAVYNEEIYCRLASAKTDPAPVDVEISEEYKAFLGDWSVTGTSTETGYYATYTLRIDQMTPNRSFKVYGWSESQASQDFPFEMSYDESTHKVAINTPQVLGEKTIDGKTYEVHFVAKLYDSGYNMVIAVDYNGPAFTGYIYGTRLSLSPNSIVYAGYERPFKTMAYVLYDKESGGYYSLDSYDITDFHIDRK